VIVGWGRGARGTDAARAAELYRKGCDAGDTDGCANAGIMYERGEGVPKDEARAAELLRKSCDAGIAVGCSDLGSLYAQGRGVPKDEARAAELYGKACDGEIEMAADSLFHPKLTHYLARL